MLAGTGELIPGQPFKPGWFKRESMKAKLFTAQKISKNFTGLSLLLAALAISSPSAAVADSGGLMGAAQPKSYTGKPQGYQGVFPGTTNSYTTASLNSYNNRGYDPNNPYCRP